MKPGESCDLVLTDLNDRSHTAIEAFLYSVLIYGVFYLDYDIDNVLNVLVKCKMIWTKRLFFIDEV